MTPSELAERLEEELTPHQLWCVLYGLARTGALTLEVVQDAVPPRCVHGRHIVWSGSRHAGHNATSYRLHVLAVHS